MNSGVEFVREELTAILPLYTIIEDCIKGEKAIKDKKNTYLPVPDEDDDNNVRSDRYLSYLQRAKFYNVTERTIDGLVGHIFTKDPEIELPEILKSFIKNATGTGLSLIQLGKDAVYDTLTYGRGGFFTDFPNDNDPNENSRKDLEDGLFNPTINFHTSKNITNWLKIKVGSNEIYSLINLKETIRVPVNEFESKEETQYRVLRLVTLRETMDEIDMEENSADVEAGVDLDKLIYRVEIWRENGSAFQPQEVYIPEDFSGNILDRIPFKFTGSKNNDDKIDPPPMYSIASLNLGHFINSADYEEACFITGQPTIVPIGVTQEWYDDVLKGKMKIGSRGGFALNENADVRLLQPEPNILPFEAMQHKERQMVALGAKLAEQKNVQRTATETKIEESGQQSVLISTTNNVGEALLESINIALFFVTDGSEVVDEDSKYTFKLNTDLDIQKMNPQERNELRNEWIEGGISFTEYRTALKKAGFGYLDDEQALAEIVEYKKMFAKLNEELAPKEEGDDKKETKVEDEDN